MIKKVNIGETVIIAGRKKETTTDILRFAESDWECCEIDISRYKNSSTAYNSYNTAIRNNNIKTVSLVRKNGKIYLIKKEVSK